MKILFLFSIILLLAACSRNNNDTGGPLPMIVTNWTDITDGDVLLLSYDTTITDIDTSSNQIIATIGDDQPIPRRVAAQMLEIIGHSYPGEFAPQEMLTLEQAQEIISKLHPAGMAMHLTEENRTQYISYALWVELYIQLLNESHGVQAINIIPLGTADGQILTNMGTFGGKDINLTAFLDQEIRILRRNKEIIAVLGVTNFTPTLKNAMLTHSDAFGITVFVGGAVRNYVFPANEPGVDMPANTQEVQIANIQINGQEIISITKTEAVITGTIERVRHNIIDLREWGAVPVCPFFAVYEYVETGSGAHTRTPQDLLVGANMASFHIINGRIAGAVITRSTSPVNIRVAIGTSNFAGLVHESITITSTGSFTVHGASGTENFSAGQHFTVSSSQNADLWGNIRLYITPQENHRLEIVGLGRNWPDGQNPKYRGVMEITRYNGNGGGFVLINELCIEEYLYAVIPSEMPTYHGLEAAKVQAITARSFAIHQFYQNAFRQFGAHVDDSVISQVYNNIPETEISIAAVKATLGQVLTVNEELVIANYFSTSGGTTANFGEVWPSGRQFPGYTPAHLTSQLQFHQHEHHPVDLSVEQNAAIFFRNVDLPAFERQFPWFRWQVRLTVEELSSSINANIIHRQAANPFMIELICRNGQLLNEDIQTNGIGQLTNMEITRRGQGGNIMEMLLTGTEATIRVQTEFNIRTLLNPGSTPVFRHDGSHVSNLRLLPSAFFTMEKETDANGYIIAITFHGGGNGHGVGMSQNGVKALVDMGMDYREILQHFYPGVEVGVYIR